MGAADLFHRCASVRLLFPRAARVALAMAAAAPSLSVPSLAAGLTPDRAAGLAAFASGVSIGADADGGACAEIALVSRSRARARGQPLACNAIALAPQHELKVSHGEAFWTLGFAGGDARGFGQVRALFGWNHTLSAGLFGDWRLHGDLALARPAGDVPFLPVTEATRFSLSRGLPYGWGLKLDAAATAQGAFDPMAAVEQDAEYAAELSRRFRLTPFAADQKVTLRLARDIAVSPVYDTAQETMLARFGYSHALPLGTLGASLAWSKTEATGAPPQAAARTELRYALAF